MNTAATYGSISTQHFGDKFDADKVDTYLRYEVRVHPPHSVKYNPNVTLHFQTEKLLLKELSSGEDELSGGQKDYTPPKFSSYSITSTRNVIQADVRKQKLDLMPGFKITWYYSGNSSIEVEPEAIFYNSNKAFVRLGSTLHSQHDQAKK